MPYITVEPAEDTWLNAASPNANNGTSTRMTADTDDKMLLRFDLSSIPAGAVCTAANLTFRCFGAGDIHTLTAYAILPANTAWAEGDSTWNHIDGGSTAWAGAAGCNSPGVDYDAMAVGTGTRSSIYTDATVSINIDPSLVGGWFAGGDNHGIVIRSSGTIEVRSSDLTSPSDHRPKLTVTYTFHSDPAEGIGETAGPTVTLGSINATPAAAEAIADAPSPTVIQASIPPIPLMHEGDIYLETRGERLYILLLATSGDNWVLCDDDDNPVTLAVRVTRQTAHLIPQ